MEKEVKVDGEGEKWIKHYSSRHEILLVGEGDFSFAACLAKAFGSAANMIATSLNSREELTTIYTKAAANTKMLEDSGCVIVHEVDAHTMSQHPLLSLKSFDRIIFNFPHAGFTDKEHSILQIGLHKNLVMGFFRSSRDMLKENGEVHVTHKTTHPFNKWDIEKLAEDSGLSLIEKVWFTTWDYPGYENKRGSGIRCAVGFPVGESSTFKFAKRL